VRDAKSLARVALDRGYDVITGGTDNHMVLISLRNKGVTGKVAEEALADCGIIVNKNFINGDTRPPSICSGLRLGTNTVAYRGMEEREMEVCFDLVDRVLSSIRVIGETQYELPPSIRTTTVEEVAQLCARFPIPGYTLVPEEARYTSTER
jgi:glycine hydroxymethyltransferase